MFRFTIIHEAMLLVCVAVCGCSGTKPPHQQPQTAVQANELNSHSFASTALLVAEKCRSQYLQVEYSPLWNPPSNAVDHALNELPAFLLKAGTSPLAHAHYDQVPNLQKRLPQTVCQVVGVTLNNEKAILLNCLPKPARWDHRWKEDFIKFYDGGPAYWSVVYLPDEHRFTRLRIDLGF